MKRYFSEKCFICVIPKISDVKSDFLFLCASVWDEKVRYNMSYKSWNMYIDFLTIQLEKPVVLTLNYFPLYLLWKNENSNEKNYHICMYSFFRSIVGYCNKTFEICFYFNYKYNMVFTLFPSSPLALLPHWPSPWLRPWFINTTQCIYI